MASLSYRDYSKWGIADELEKEQVVATVQQLAAFDVSDIKQPFDEFQKSRDALIKSLTKFLRSADQLPANYLQQIPVAESIVLSDQTLMAITNLPNVFIKHSGVRLPKKGVHTMDRIIEYLASLYYEKTGKRPTVSTDPYDANYKKTGDFINFLDSVLADAKVEMPSIHSRAKERLKLNRSR